MSRTTKRNLKEEYFHWLESQISGDSSVDIKHRELFTLMFDTPFGWIDEVPMDENRVIDGRDLRIDFAKQVKAGTASVNAWKEMMERTPVSFLEVLIGLSRRLAFVAGGSAPLWAWQLVNNLELHRATDPLSHPEIRKIKEALARVIERTYSPNGMGGFFPLSWPDEDQTRVELWYQLNSYVEELHPEI